MCYLFLAAKKKPDTPETKEISLLGALNFDNSKKWIANIETQDGVLNMNSIIMIFNLKPIRIIWY